MSGSNRGNIFRLPFSNIPKTSVLINQRCRPIIISSKCVSTHVVCECRPTLPSALAYTRTHSLSHSLSPSLSLSFSLSFSLPLSLSLSLSESPSLHLYFGILCICFTLSFVHHYLSPFFSYARLSVSHPVFVCFLSLTLSWSVFCLSPALSVSISVYMSVCFPACLWPVL